MLIKGVTSDSRAVKKDFAFVAVKGVNQDGHDFIDEAIKRGARTIVIQNPKSEILNTKQIRNPKVKIIKVKDTRKTLAQLAAKFYGNPSQKIKVVGITGTNGKTTISYLIESILKKAGKPSGVIGTINYHFRRKVISAKNTTPGPVELQALLSDMLRAKADYAVMEVSSHALDQRRVEAIKFRAAIFTNLTQDHLDYHKNMESYFKAKALLFNGLDKNAWAVVNIDDSFGRRLVRLTKARMLTYAIEKKAHIRAQDIEFGLEGVNFSLKWGRKNIPVKSRLIGRHNVYNILAAVSFAITQKIDINTIISAIEEFMPVCGRLEPLPGNWPVKVFVDYAHTEDALRNVIISLREFAKAKIIVVFGCGGDRDRLKRPKMGEVVSKLADAFIITNDNPRSEDPQAIINEIKKGIKANIYKVIPDRRKAIGESLAMAKRGDIILIAGKGHENYQIFKNKTVNFNDRRIALECLRSMKS